MLKKLLASVLAVATVATCAYVPSALASADTTYKTATAVDYAIWELNNPAAAEDKVKVTVYIATNVEDVKPVILDGVKVAENNVETIKAKLAETDIPGIGKIKDESANAMVKHEITAVATTAATNVYVAHIVETQAVVYSEYNTNAVATADTKAETLADADMKLLGYYTSPIDAPAVLKDMYANVANAKLANKEFAYWNLKGNVVVPKYKEQLTDEGKIYYTPVTLKFAATGAANAAELVAGTYALETGKFSSNDTVRLPNNDKANWNTYLVNFAKINGWYNVPVNTNDKEPVVYVMAGVRQIADKSYAAVFTKKDLGAEKSHVTYILSLCNKDTGAFVMLDKAKAVEFAKDAQVYTTDPAEIYAMIKEDADKATLAEWLVQNKDVHGTIYDLGDVYYTNVNVRDGQVKVSAYIIPKEEYTVYSFAEGDKVVKSTVYLTAAQAANSEYYANKDLTGVLAQEKKVVKATADELGVAPTATIDGVPAVYAYAQTSGTVINATYKMGDATATLADFATTTGAFDAEAYFCRDAKAGDEVTLKVSLSAAGEAKGFDVAKIAVEFNTIGATAGETYAYTGSELYKDGTAANITLVEGTNIVTATVYYNGVKVGTFAPFYAAV